MLRRAVRSRMHKHRRSPAHNRQQRMQRRTHAATVCSMNVVAVHATVNAGAILHTASAAHRRRFHQMPRWCAESQNTDSTDFVRSWICLCVRHWFQQPNSSACLGVAVRCGAVRCGAKAKNLPARPACRAQYPTVTPPAIQVFNISVDSLAAPAAAHGRPCATARKALRAAVRADKLTLLDDTLAATRTSDRSGEPWAERCALHVASGFIHDVPCHASRTRDRLQRL